MSMTKVEDEQEFLTRLDGKNKAEVLRDAGGEDPFPKDPKALLSDGDIQKYVLATGAISPFYVGGERNRLKKASYEGRIGEHAYLYDDNKCLVKTCTNPLVVKENSIVFVECDLDFRLPDFMALRFNLQIRHVHRGLLLGTGPLIDPGFWGKLCIPLHNLTDEDYSIPKSEGLIWIEFTKTSGNVKGGRNPLAQVGDRKEHWCIKKFINKAASPINGLGKHVAIRSSIPLIAKDAEKKAAEAVESAKEAKKNATAAVKSARKAQRTLFTFGLAGAVAILIALVGLGYTAYSNIQTANNATRSAYNAMLPEIKKLQDDVTELKIQNRNLVQKLDKAKGK